MGSLTHSVFLALDSEAEYLSAQARIEEWEAPVALAERTDDPNAWTISLVFEPVPAEM